MRMPKSPFAEPVVRCVIKPEGDDYGWVLSQHRTAAAAKKGLKAAVDKRVKRGIPTRIHLGYCIAVKTGDRVYRHGQFWLTHSRG